MFFILILASGGMSSSSSDYTKQNTHIMKFIKLIYKGRGMFHKLNFIWTLIS